MIDPHPKWHSWAMPPHLDNFGVRWLRGVIAAAVGLNLSACADRDFEDFAEESRGSGMVEGGTAEGGTTGDEPVACPDSPIIVEVAMLPDGTCGVCDEACLAAADTMAQATQECSEGCWCEADAHCSVTAPDADGMCLHGFGVYWEACGGSEGRPLLVGTEVRVAATCTRSDWTCAAPRFDVPPLLRERVREGWLDRAAMEHASVAAFARFTLQLLSLGAPAELIDASQQAGRDEARHARLCYAIASQLGGPVGPDRLDLRGLDLDVDPARVVLESILEGCIGETIAAAKMRYLAARVENPDIAAMLESIAEDEAMHAALAWKALDWMLRTFDVGAVARETFATAISQMSRSHTHGRESAMLRYGVLDEATSEWVTASVLRDVIAPAAAGLLDARLAA
jgi:hypothetical protein